MQVKQFSQLEDGTLLHEVIDQLNKDLASDNDPLEWLETDASPYDGFVHRVERYFRNLLSGSRRQLMSVLYRVDLPEKKTNQIWVLEDEARVKKLTEMVLNRELQKVVTRRLYRGK